MKPANIPLSLYIHIPWCLKKCPYCDFNSHTGDVALHEKAYIDRLLYDLAQHTDVFENRSLHSIFIGGGTPSLFSADSYDRLLKGIRAHTQLPGDLEITLEANPGTAEQARFSGYYDAGINRLSIGIQSLNNNSLKQLGRIHSAREAIQAVDIAEKAGFSRINIDMMYGLPNQTLSEAMTDLQQAINLDPSHLSWYQLTLEPNTLFYRYPPPLPAHDQLVDIEDAGLMLLQQAHFTRYEVSAYCQFEDYCQHNLNYWQFGDYLGIGAGSHSKLTDPHTHSINRFWKNKLPHNYLNPDKPLIAKSEIIQEKTIAFEFMLNHLRLYQPLCLNLLYERTGLTIDDIQTPVSSALTHRWLTQTDDHIYLTERGQRYLNDVISLFLPNQA